ncbi:hypothetical protein B0T17DRAFT_6433 [Bombardia bombarda]|uniref:Secreted protein n=1 Tax=Bombardia bombarda TaxID=252184 RepID=A0AA40CDH4_9PEZI|nr:hypothetical protein B0T17DRAFT_6433 [Bombardia bombarda]
MVDWLMVDCLLYCESLGFVCQCDDVACAPSRSELNKQTGFFGLGSVLGSIRARCKIGSGCSAGYNRRQLPFNVVCNPTVHSVSRSLKCGLRSPLLVYFLRWPVSLLWTISNAHVGWRHRRLEPSVVTACKRRRTQARRDEMKGRAQAKKPTTTGTFLP